MSVFDRFLNSIKINDDDDLDDDEYFDEDDEEMDDSRPSRRFLKRDEEEDDDSFDDRPVKTTRQPDSRSSGYSRKNNAVRQSTSPKVSAFRPRKTADEASDSTANNFSVCVIRPKSMEDALQIAQMLISHCVIILNLEGLDLSVSQRVFDFASGACCAVRGRLDKISNYIFVLTPHDVDISGEFQEILTGAFDQDLDIDNL